MATHLVGKLTLPENLEMGRTVLRPFLWSSPLVVEVHSMVLKGPSKWEGLLMEISGWPLPSQSQTVSM